VGYDLHLLCKATMVVHWVMLWDGYSSPAPSKVGCFINTFFAARCGATRVRWDATPTLATDDL
jgi:hypothetical protein